MIFQKNINYLGQSRSSQENRTSPGSLVRDFNTGDLLQKENFNQNTGGEATIRLVLLGKCYHHSAGGTGVGGGRWGELALLEC